MAKNILISVFFITAIWGCASAPQVKPPPVSSSVPGIYHRVEKGETLWRISKIYNIDIEELIRVNKISDITNLEAGQMIFVPGGKKPQAHPQPVAYPNNEDFIWPVRGKIISGFGGFFDNMINEGIDIQPNSDSEVVAARSGKVVFYSPDFYGFGKTVILDHGDGFLSVYARNAKVFIKVGDNIQKGSVIATVGSSGRDRTQYLHFEIRKGHQPQNPNFYLP